MKHLVIVIPPKATFFLIIKALTTTNLYNNSVSPKFFRAFYSVSPKFYNRNYHDVLTLISQSKSPQRQDIACTEFYVISNHKALRGIYYLLLAFFLASHFKSHAVNLKITDTTIALTLCNFFKKMHCHSAK